LSRVAGHGPEPDFAGEGAPVRFFAAPIYRWSSLVGCLACVVLGLLAPLAGLGQSLLFYLCAGVWMIRFLMLTWLPYLEIASDEVIVRNGWLEGNRWFRVSDIQQVDFDARGEALTIRLDDGSKVMVHGKRVPQDRRAHLKSAVIALKR
jgi:hypothetical protein